MGSLHICNCNENVLFSVNNACDFMYFFILYRYRFYGDLKKVDWNRSKCGMEEYYEYYWTTGRKVCWL